MTDISVIIVSYRNADLLMLTLASVRRAAQNLAADGLEAEVIVVDNKSDDGTAERMASEAPWARFIEMPTNAGFSRANNEAMRQCTGRVVLILNPDTVLCAHTLRRLIDHFRSNPGSGAVGVRMVNGLGAYLRESKRGYTTLATSFFKLSGLWRLAPQSPVLNAYYIGNVEERDTCHAPILSGACMAFSHSLMNRTGFFDEDYFMYSEDIDMSWRLNNASADGNQYRGDIPIIHFKGQSTPRRKVYIGHFYDSMLLFAQKHEFKKHGRLVNAITFLGIKTAYAAALLRCVIMRNAEAHRTFEVPEKVAFVTDNANLQEKAKQKTTPVPYAQMERAANADAVVFDIDGPVEQAIEHMRALHGRQLFGFYNPDNHQALLFFNNRCHQIEIW